MTNLPKTFCPAKWDQIFVNLGANYVYACCRAEVVKIVKKEDINTALNQQKTNLLNGIQDPSCNYCWNVENAGYHSQRQLYLSKFDVSRIDQYKHDQITPTRLEINLGNECNFQCTYCNPKFSSQWESDVKSKPYKLYSDRYFYAVEDKNSNNIADTIDWLREIKTVDKLELIGGEPLQNKNFFKVIDAIRSKQLGLVTNLSVKNIKSIDKILNLSNRYEKINFGISIDSTGKNAEFSRYGMKFDLLLKNINYLLVNAKPNVIISFHSVMTSITIRDFNNIVDLMDTFYKINSNIMWYIGICRDPTIFTLNTLPDKFKPNLLEKINSIKDRNYIEGLSILEGAIKTSKFNITLYNQMKHFLEEFSTRKNIAIPVILE